MKTHALLTLVLLQFGLGLDAVARSTEANQPEQVQSAKLKDIKNTAPNYLTFRGEEYQLIDGASLSSLLDDVSLVIAEDDGHAEGYNKNGQYFRGGDRAPVTASYVIKNNQACINPNGVLPELCRAFYKNKSDQYVALNTSVPDLVNNPHTVKLKPHER